MFFSKPVKILSIDGGGIRGIIPAIILSEIEKRTNKPISSLFDLIAGTSTGGILALGLVVPTENRNPAYSAEELALLYEFKGKTVFPETLARFQFIIKRLQEIGVINEKYPSEFIGNTFDNMFKENTLKDALTNIIITSYDIYGRKPFFFKSKKALTDSSDNFFMKDVAYATSAAPSFFNPLKVCVPGSNEHCVMVDGAIIANNPSLCAYVEAKKYYPRAKDFIMVSLGTGNPSSQLSYEDACQWKRAQWTRKLIYMCNHGMNDTVDYQLKSLLSGKRNNYYRFQTILSPESEEIDNVYPENISRLKEIALKMIKENDKVLDELCRKLT